LPWQIEDKFPWNVYEKINRQFDDLIKLDKNVIYLSDYRMVINGKMRIEVKIGDIVFDNADIIVNSSNEHLIHDGGLGRNINQKGGK